MSALTILWKNPADKPKSAEAQVQIAIQLTYAEEIRRLKHDLAEARHELSLIRHQFTKDRLTLSRLEAKCHKFTT